MGDGSITYQVTDITDVTEISWEGMFEDPDAAPDVALSTSGGSDSTSCGHDCGIGYGTGI